MTSEQCFDIFSGSIDKDILWIEAVTGLATAEKRMAELATQTPGRYFIFSIQSNGVLAEVDTTKNFIKAGGTRKAKNVA